MSRCSVAGDERAVEGDVVAVDLRGRRGLRQGRGRRRARHEQIGSERDLLAEPGGHEVGDHAPRPRCEVEVDRPGAVGGQLGVHVLVPGEVAAHHHEVELLVVLHLVVEHGLAVRTLDLEGQRVGAVRARRRRGDEPVAAVGDGEAARHGTRRGVVSTLVTAVPGVPGAVRGVLRLGRGDVDGTHERAGTQREPEDRAETEDEGDQPCRSVHLRPTRPGSRPPRRRRGRPRRRRGRRW